MIMYFEPRVTFLPRSREFSGNPIIVSWHLGQNIGQNINEIASRPLSFIFAAARTAGAEHLIMARFEKWCF